MKKCIKGYFVKKREVFQTGNEARARAGILRLDKNIEHVKANTADGIYFVEYSIAKWYLEEAIRVGITV
jgi:hypothetical protein